ncbi:hypothetical protein FHS76_000001 [Ochrobactrum daejeonense]|uniref:Uncharacterized protein n=1 Tax=Brucella daejeonensis TaxID=659015 RepID=A0A7W9AT76_9HYPH|nr:hypothetical protein [Brucella daejeonensis]MBB5700163.1 hypothetical protein [Brucella daejeonensis]
MTYYALKDSDWAFDDQDEGRAIIVQADTPEEAISKATEMHIKEFPGAGGVTWDVARLDLTGIGDAEWEDDNIPKYEKFRFYDDGLNEPSEIYKRMKALETQLAAAKKALDAIASMDDYFSGDRHAKCIEIARAALEDKP